MILVYDDLDDDYMISECPIFGVIDDRLNDRTHKVTIDSEVLARYYPKTSSEISLTPVGLNAPAAKLTTPTPRVIEGKATLEYETFRFNPVVYPVDAVGTQIPVINPLWVTINLENMRSIYSQVGVQMLPNPIPIVTPVQGVNIYDGLDYPSPEFDLLLEMLGPSRDPSNFYLIYVCPLNSVSQTPSTNEEEIQTLNRPGYNTSRELLGMALVSHECATVPDTGSNNCFINAPRVIILSSFTTPLHEIGHCLTRYDHFNFCWNTTNDSESGFSLHSSVSARKRFSDQLLPTPICATPLPLNQEDRIHVHDQVN